MVTRQNFTTPVGRLVMGSLYKAQTTDAEGHPLVIKTGVNAGQPKVIFFFAVAIPKGSEQHWNQTTWGGMIYATGKEAFPQAHLSPTFAWKILDGDSNIPNRRGTIPSSREGYPGNWVISFNSGFAPKIYNKDGSAAIVEPDAVKLGYFVQVNADVSGNGSQQQPGAFINHNMVAFSAYGEEIYIGADATAVGFGQGPLPPGAMDTPVAGFAPVAPGVPVAPFPPGVPVAPFAPGVPVAPVAAGVPVAPVAPPPPPNPAILKIPQKRVMTDLADGYTYEALIAAGWTDDLLRQHGIML